MATTALSLVQQACYANNSTNVPTALVGATDASTLQLTALFYSAGRYLRSCGAWPQLKRSYTIYLQAGRKQYHLPQDWYCAIPQSSWDKQNNWEMAGPLTDGQWNSRTNGWVSTTNRKGFKVFGSDNPNDTRGQFYVDPVPGYALQDQRITFDYISRNWLNPPNWVASGTVGATDKCNSNGNLYSHASGTTCGTSAPSMAYGEGQDGSIYWKYFTKAAWGSTTVYKPGDYVTNGGNLYVCVIGGTSAGSGGPTGTSTTTNVTDNTVTWLYKAVGSWTAETSFTEGQIILISASYYRCVTAGTTGTVQPTWTLTTESDSTITWTHYTTPYETILSDSDICLFDDELMIMQLRWRFMQARGMQFADLQAEAEALKSSAMGRWQEGQLIDFAGDGFGPSGLFPLVQDGNFTF